MLTSSLFCQFWQVILEILESILEIGNPLRKDPPQMESKGFSLFNLLQIFLIPMVINDEISMLSKVCIVLNIILNIAITWSNTSPFS